MEKKPDIFAVPLPPDADRRTEKSARRTLFWFISTVLVIVLVAAVAISSVYLGHLFTQSSYQDKVLSYEGQRLKQAQHNEFSDSSGPFSVIYDYKNKMVILLRSQEFGDSCYVVPFSGTKELNTVKRLIDIEKIDVLSQNDDKNTAVKMTIDLPAAGKKECIQVSLFRMSKDGQDHFTRIKRQGEGDCTTKKKSKSKRKGDKEKTITKTKKKGAGCPDK